ncbi:MAG: hypothetical protein AAF415_01660 [Pseudomonadota bacterium]
MNKRNEENEAKLLLDAQRYRDRYETRANFFDPIRHIERDLMMRRDFDHEWREEVTKDGKKVEAKVSFDKNGAFLEISNNAIIEAHAGIGEALHTLYHEISHTILHTSKYCRQSKSYEMARSGVYDIGSFRTDPEDEWEANVFGSGLHIPIDMVFPETTVSVLKWQYKASETKARRAIEQKRRLWKVIERIRNGRDD